VTALVYVRQSRTEVGTTSPEVQEEECRRLDQVASCGEVIVHRDLDVSGGKLKGRGGYVQLLKRIESSRKDEPLVVAAYDQSRCFRNTQDALNFFAAVEKRPWIEVVFVHGRFDRTPTGEFTYTAMAAAHSMERKMTGAKVAATYRHKNTRGEPTGMPPYGYRRAGKRGDKDRPFEIDDKEAAIIRLVFDHYASGAWSARALAKKLNDDGVIKPASRSKGLGWVPDTVVDLLSNVAYVGKTYSVSRARREGDVIPASWPAIIEHDLFVRVQEVLKSKRFRHPGGPRKRDYAFARLLICTHCGQTMRALTNYGHVYYHCRRDIANPCPGASRTVREDRLLPWADHLFRRLAALRPDALAKMQEQKPRLVAGDLEQLDRSLERYKLLFTWGHIDADEYQRQYERLTALREDRIKESTPRRTYKISIVWQAKEVIIYPSEGVYDQWRRGTALQRRLLLMGMFEALEVRDGQIVRYRPRPDRAQEVQELVLVATGGRATVKALAIPRPGQHGRLFASGGKGGV